MTFEYKMTKLQPSGSERGMIIHGIYEPLTRPAATTTRKPLCRDNEDMFSSIEYVGIGTHIASRYEPRI
jgi:hypothetical protein